MNRYACYIVNLPNMEIGFNVCSLSDDFEVLV